MCKDDAIRRLMNAIFGRDGSHHRLPIYQAYYTRDYHARASRQNWAFEKIRADHRSTTRRSQTEFKLALTQKDAEEVQHLLIQPQPGVFCLFEDDLLTVYSPTESLSLKHLNAFLANYVNPRATPVPRFYLLNHRGNGFEVEGVDLLKPTPISDGDLTLNYGEDAVRFEQRLVTILSGDVHGAVVFRGEPGTGKTTFIRHLIAKLRESHRFYYLPVSACQYLASPSMVDFWLGQSRQAPETKRVVILEDAEDLIMNRGNDNQAQVSGLLNAADGLLGDFLRLTLLLTVNCHIDKLDPALTRPGRLIAYREFPRMRAAEAQRLAAAKSIPLPSQQDYSLAEVYRGAIRTELEAPRCIGFGA